MQTKVLYCSEFSQSRQKLIFNICQIYTNVTYFFPKDKMEKLLIDPTNVNLTIKLTFNVMYENFNVPYTTRCGG